MTEASTNTISIALLILGIGVVLFLTYLILVNSIKILKMIGPTGNAVMMKIMGLIVMVIAVEFFLAGLRPYIEIFLN